MSFGGIFTFTRTFNFLGLGLEKIRISCQNIDPWVSGGYKVFTSWHNGV